MQCYCYFNISLPEYQPYFIFNIVLLYLSMLVISVFVLIFTGLFISLFNHVWIFLVRLVVFAVASKKYYLA